MTSIVVSEREAAERKTPSSLFIVTWVASLGLVLAVAVAFVSGPGTPVDADPGIIVQGP